MITLKVVEENTKFRQGLIVINGETFYTLERGWNDNKPFKSCVPRGVYELVPYESNKYGDCFVMTNHELNVYGYKNHPKRPEDGRYKCLFAHRGSYPKNFVGCVGAGDDWTGEVITNTRNACKRLMDLVGSDEDLRLEII